MKTQHFILLDRDRTPMMGSIDINRIYDFVSSINPLHQSQADITVAINDDKENIIHCEWNTNLCEPFGGYIVIIDIYDPLPVQYTPRSTYPTEELEHIYMYPRSGQKLEEKEHSFMLQMGATYRAGGRSTRCYIMDKLSFDGNRFFEDDNFIRDTFLLSKTDDRSNAVLYDKFVDNYAVHKDA